MSVSELMYVEEGRQHFLLRMSCFSEHEQKSECLASTGPGLLNGFQKIYKVYFLTLKHPKFCEVEYSWFHMVQSVFDFL